MSLIAYGKERTGQDRGEDSPLRFHPVSVNIAVLGNLFYSVDQSHSQPVSPSVSRSVSWSVSWSPRQSSGWSVSWSVSRSLNWSESQSVSPPIKASNTQYILLSIDKGSAYHQCVYYQRKYNISLHSAEANEVSTEAEKRETNRRLTGYSGWKSKAPSIVYRPLGLHGWENHSVIVHKNL